MTVVSCRGHEGYKIGRKLVIKYAANEMNAMAPPTDAMDNRRGNDEENQSQQKHAKGCAHQDGQ